MGSVQGVKGRGDVPHCFIVRTFLLLAALSLLKAKDITLAPSATEQAIASMIVLFTPTHLFDW